MSKLYFNSLNQEGYTIVEYVWIGGFGDDIRSKSKTFHYEIHSINDVPDWNFDGSSTGLAQTEESEVILKPVSLFKDPFRGGKNKIALCETYYSNGKPTITNFRFYAKQVFSNENMTRFEPWFGVEQEYLILKSYGSKVNWPIGWTPGEFLSKSDQYYCSNGANNTFGREIVDAHLKACLYAGVKIYGVNAEVLPSQWEFQVGTCNGIEVCDHLLIGRFLLIRVAEEFNSIISFEPKPFKEFNGSGCHTNFSTKQTREDKELKEILSHMTKLESSHKKFIELYGENNNLRLVGNFEAPDINTFTYGVMNRKASIRIPKQTEIDGKGYYEDRRPASNCDVYLVPSLIFSSTCLDGFLIDDMHLTYKDYIKNKIIRK